MKEYLDLLKRVLDNGAKKDDRTGTGTISLFGTQTRYDLSKGFPLVTTKKVNFNAIKHELLWFIAGDTNIEYLVKNNVNIWNEWPFENYKKSNEYQNETIKEFAEKVKNNHEFAKKWGNLGPVYGKQWRNFNGVDQLKDLIIKIKNNPDSRRMIISAWNPKEIEDMLLPPCHSLFQFYVINGRLSCQLYQRSGDLFLGVPFNIASYSLLILLIAQVANLKPGEFIHTIGDTHIYLNHLDQVKEQLSREPLELPKIKLNPNIDNIFEFRADDIELVDYKHHDPIRAKVAV